MKSKENSLSYLHTPDYFKTYHHKLSIFLEKLSLREYLFKKESFPNGMPKPKPKRLSFNDHAVVPAIMDGVSYSKFMASLYKLEALTQDHLIKGPNVDFLSMFLIFADLRQDDATKITVPGYPGELAISEEETSTSKNLAKMLRYVAGLNLLVTLDGHSGLAASHFKEVGIDVINITAVFSMIDSLIERGLLGDDLENVICGLDFGNLPLVKAIKNRYKNFSLAVIQKFRIPPSNGESQTDHKLIFGDVKGKRVILTDDMISSGGTLLKTVELLLSKGAVEIIICVTHPVLSKGYKEKLKKLIEINEVKIVMVTNSIPFDSPELEEAKELPIAEDGQEIEVFDINNFISMVLLKMLATKDPGVLKEELSEYVVEQGDPYDILEELTKIKMSSPEVTHTFDDKGEFSPL